MFLEYYAHPYQTTKYFKTSQHQIDFNERRAVLVEGSEASLITLTAVSDVAKVVARAVDYEGEWPVTGGIKGEDVSIAQLIKLGESIRGV
jgi:hypothetical protein